MKQAIDIIWCKKNLRVNDNEILANINPEKPTLGVYFFEPKIMSLPDFSDFHLKFILDSLLELQKSFMELGIPLLLLPYNAIEGLRKLQTYFDIQTLFSHEETGNWQTFMRDKQVLSFCKEHNIEVREYETNGIVRRLSDRDNWNSIWKKRISKNIFLPQRVHKIVEIPTELCDISKHTKELYRTRVSSISGIQK